ncbi:hypothetical protein [Streptomyces celluloflavus]|uniref:hypothetical protein n=1 Tax=Streptomyces celluloflavus TaxID=58344 RepID=UPI0036AA6F3A
MSTQQVWSGATKPGDGWTDADSSIYINVDTSAGKFKSTPTYVASLTFSKDEGGAFEITGLSSIYEPSPKGFTVHVAKGKNKVTVDQAKDRNYAVNWVGVGQA